MRALAAHPSLRALRHRNFRVFYTGHLVSVLGTWMQSVATSWLVYRLSGSPFLLGFTAFAQQIPYLVLTPFAGVLADRFDRRRVLMVVQSLALLQAATLAVLTLLGTIQVWHVITLVLMLGIVNAFETPMRQSLLLDLVADRDDLPNAIALQSFCNNATRLIGPTLGGLLLAAAGEGWCFAFNALTFLAIIVAYNRIRIDLPAVRPQDSAILRELTAGFRYVFADLATRRLIVVVMVLSVFTSPLQPLLPIYAAERFDGDSRTLGILIGSIGVGAILGTVYLASRMSVRGLGRVISATLAAAGAAMLVFAFAGKLWQALLILPLFGFGLIVTASSCNSILQTVAADHLRGRVVSIYVMFFLGIAPLGNLLGGTIAQTFGPDWTFIVNGAGLMLGAAWFALGLVRWREAIRPHYSKQGVARDER